MDKLHVDFETRSTLDLKTAGVYKYANHPSTEILCLSYAVNNSPPKIIEYEQDFNELYPYLHKVTQGHMVLAAFNAFFERCIFQFTVRRKHLLNGMYKNIHESKYWQCTMAKSSACGLTGSLDVVSKLLNLDTTKDNAGKNIMLKMCKPRKALKKEYTQLVWDGEADKVLWHESPEYFEKLYEYCKQDVVVERKIDAKLPDLSDSEQYIWQIDQRINDSGIPVDIDSVKKAISVMAIQKVEANDKICELTEERVETINQIAKIKKELKDIHGVETQSLDVAAIDTLLHEGVSQEVKEILLLRKNNGKSSTAKYESIMDRYYDGRVHGLFSYHLATTGRWGSRGIQLHNLPRGNIKDIDTARFAFRYDAMWLYPGTSNLLSSLIRTTFIAPDGYSFAVADYSAIEARVLNWLAGQKNIVQKFINDEDVYVEMAEIIYGTSDIDDDKRFVGKQTELGCGFGMGSDRFHAQCITYGHEIPMALAIRSIKAYRKTHHMVVKFWYGIEGMVKNAIRNKKKVYHFNSICVKCTRDFLMIKLPSGRLLFYYKPTIDDDKNIRFWGYNSQTHKVENQYTYGGKLVENIVQGTARDILAHALVTLEETKYESILHVHDEICSLVPEDEADIDEYCKLVTTLPEWARGCPTKAEGWIGKYYKKD